MLMSLGQIVGYTVQATDKPAGKVADIYFDDTLWSIRQFAVADAGGVGTQMASVDSDSIASVDTGAARVNVARTQEEIAGGPDVSLDPPVSHHINAMNNPRLRSVTELKGYRLHASDGDVGALDDFIASDGNWKINLVVVATDSGRKVLVAPGMVNRIDFEAKTVQLELDSARFAGSPEYDPATPIARIEDVRLVGRDEV